MIIRFCPFWLGLTLGRLIYVTIAAFAYGNEQNVRWGYEIFAACCIGFIAASLYVIVTATLETKRFGSAKVRLW